MNVRHLPALLVPLAFATTHARAQELGVFDLDPSGTVSGGYVVDATEAGVAVGAGFVGGVEWPQPIIFTDSGPFQLATLPGDVMGECGGVNSSSTVVGTSTEIQQQGQLTFYFDKAVSWDATGAITDLAAAATGGADLELFRAWGVNESGVIVGFGRDASIPAGRGFVWDSGTIIEVPPLPGVPVSRPTQALAINDEGQVVGYAEDAGGFEHAILFDAGQLTDLHQTAGVPGRTSEAWDINSAGWVAGSADFVDDFIDWRVAAIWRPDGSVIELGTLGGTVAVTFSINDSNVAVGNARTDANELHGFIWRDGVMIDLNLLIGAGAGWEILEARHIAENGRIYGLGWDGQELQPVVLVPNPCDGFYQVYGQACAGSGGFESELAGFGCPAPGEEVILAVADGLGGSLAFLVFGTGQGTLPIVPSCDVQVLPLLAPLLTLGLDGSGPGDGSALVQSTLSPSLPTQDLFLQAVIVDPGAPDLIASTNPLQIHIE